MSRICTHDMIWGRCPTCESLTRLAAIYEVSGRLRSGDSFRPNLDRFGMPRDYETYLWATYGAGRDIPPERRAFLYGTRHDGLVSFGQQVAWR